MTHTSTASKPIPAPEKSLLKNTLWPVSLYDSIKGILNIKTWNSTITLIIIPLMTARQVYDLMLPVSRVGL